MCAQVQDLLRRTRVHTLPVPWGVGRGVGGVGNLQRLRLLREALEVEHASEHRTHGSEEARVILEAVTELEGLEASAHDS